MLYLLFVLLCLGTDVVVVVHRIVGQAVDQLVLISLVHNMGLLTGGNEWH